MQKHFKRISSIGNDNYIYYWQSKGLSDERINAIRPDNLSITPFLDYYGTKTRAEFNGSCLKRDTLTFNLKKVVNIYIVHEISKSFKVGLAPSKENSYYLLE